jgi:hypothetical protein
MQLLGRELGEVLGSNRQSRPKLVNKGSALQKGGVGRKATVGPTHGGAPWLLLTSQILAYQTAWLRHSAVRVPVVHVCLTVSRSTREGGRE